MFRIHRAERADLLAETLASVLAVAPADPFAPEVVAVPTRGMERWLTQRLSTHLGTGPEGGDGVCANVQFPFPSRLVADALACASDIDPDDDPWLPERMLWPMLELVDASLEEPWLTQLSEHLRDAPDRRLARVAQIARLLHSYAIRRPALIRAWARGDFDPAANGAWQAELWVRLRTRLGVPSGPERLEAACERLVAEPERVELPERLALFGLTRLAPSYVAVLRALAAHRDVHLMLLHPSPVLWDELAGSLPDGPLRRAEDPSAALAANRLLASWGRDARELQLAIGRPAEDTHRSLPPIDVGAHARAPTLLHALQSDVRANRRPPGPPLPGDEDARIVLPADDCSVEIHACHGRARQVEVLRDAILHRLADDPSLEPRDVIVMCPDVETFAPLIEATFGTVAGEESEGGVDLRVRLADRALRQTNPLLAVLARLLDLAGGRATASQVLDLLDTGPVRRRFALDDEGLDRIRGWVAEAGVHWGLDAEHRRRYRLSEITTGTWSAGLRRVLLGVAMDAEGGRMYAGVLPVDEVQSGAIEMAGRFTEFIDRLELTLGELGRTHTVAEWADLLGEATARFTDTSDEDAWQQREVDRTLEELRAESETRLSLAEVQALLSERLGGRPTRANFRTGELTVCTLQPMRSVPHRVICLLGLDDGAFPRKARHAGDDLLLAEPYVGDPDPRSEDRQLLLDALLAAQDALIITYTGNDERTNALRPPAVPVGELLDVIEATAAGSPRRHVVVRHPLQPFDPRNFASGALRSGGPWSFDRIALAGARALDQPRHEESPFLPEALPAVDEDGVLALDDLVSFLKHPVRGFLRQRLRVNTYEVEDELEDALPVELDGLGCWEVGQRLLEASLEGRDPRSAYLPEIASGALPPGVLGRRVIEQTLPEAARLAHRALAEGDGGEPRSVEANVTLPGGVRLSGTVPGVRGSTLLSVSYSRLKAGHRLEAWVRLLALSAAHPEIPFESVTVGRRSGRGRGVSIARIGPLARQPEERREIALRELGLLADIRARGLCEPLPLPCETAGVYAERRCGVRPDDPPGALQEANRCWASTFDFDSGEWWEREDRDPEHLLVFGGDLELRQLYALRPASDENGDGWAADEQSRFGRYAVRLWAPLLARERVTAG